MTGFAVGTLGGPATFAGRATAAFRAREPDLGTVAYDCLLTLLGPGADLAPVEQLLTDRDSVQ